MAGLEALTSTIYHEKQQPGSMLCAQHALNSLLQGHYFTAPDLSDIARNVDTLEESYVDDRGQTSANMDDTGFFSVQVLERALEVWGLKLLRWRSEDMRAYQDRPHIQLGFILNLEQHWFTLRRFGPACSNIDEDLGVGHWFNLNSFNNAPEWVSNTYLGMVLQQSEAEGYSVFVVTQADPEALLALPRVVADEVAASLPASLSADLPSSSRRPPQEPMSSIPSEPLADPEIDSESFEDEDWELQAALQASLMQHGGYQGDETMSDSHPAQTQDVETFPPLPSVTPPGGGVRTPQPWGSQPSVPHAGSGAVDEELDPVAASMERSRQLLQRFQAEQEYAQREMWSEADLTPDEAQALQERRERRHQEEEREEEELRKAIEESERLAEEQRSRRARISKEDEEDTEMTSVPAHPSAPSSGVPGHLNDHRIYDDEDAELQAALKASLENVPPDWEVPEDAQHETPQYNMLPAMPRKDREDSESIASADTGTTETDNEDKQPPPEPLNLDEIRRRRLARFGL